MAHTIYVHVLRNTTCEATLEEKFKVARRENLPAPAKPAKSFMEALGEVQYIYLLSSSQFKGIVQRQLTGVERSTNP